MIRLYRDSKGGLRFKGKDPEAERLAARALVAERREFEDRLHAENMRLLGETVPTRKREVVHVVKDESEEAPWRAWSGYLN